MVIVKNNYKVKEQIQYAALNRWREKGKHGTVLLATGFGKTFVALHALYTMTKGDGKTHLFLAETNERFHDLEENIRKYNIIFQRDVCADYKVEFMCYQSAYKLEGEEFGLIMADEIHDSLTPVYSQFYFNNNFDALIGLSARVNRNINYDLDNGEYTTKGMLLDQVAPVAYEYKLGEAVKEGTARDMTIHVIYNDLDTKNPTVKAGNAKNPFFQSEYKAYKYWNTRYNKAFNIPTASKRDAEIFKATGKQRDILYNLQTKVYITKLLLRYLDRKTIIFGNSLDFLYKITENVVSSRNTDDRNWQIREWFNNGIIKFIGSFKKLKQGANLAEDLDNCIITSYYSKKVDFEQRVGRLRENGYKGNIFVIVTRDTQEVRWFNQMIKSMKNVPMVEHESIFNCIDYIKNEKINN